MNGTCVCSSRESTNFGGTNDVTNGLILLRFAAHKLIYSFRNQTKFISHTDRLSPGLLRAAWHREWKWIENVAHVIDGEFNHVFPQCSSPIKMVGHQDDEKWSSVECSTQISLRNLTAALGPDKFVHKRWSTFVRVCFVSRMARPTVIVNVPAARCLIERYQCWRHWRSRASLISLPIYSHRAFIFTFCVRHPNPLPAKWLMIIISYISIASAWISLPYGVTEWLKREYGYMSGQTIFIDRVECSHNTDVSIFSK